MEISLGFLIVLILILFPGLIYRRLYFYGEFSKQFNYGNNLISLIAISTIPGIINLISVYIFYDNIITGIDLGEIIDKFKDINNPEFRLTKCDDTPLKDIMNEKVAPFIGFTYMSSILFGILSGRFIRISRIDTKFKLLRFKNYWFYLFNGQHTGFKKMKHLKEKNKKHLFTKVDILIDSNSKTHLYSGIVVDYELQDDDCKALSKIMLQNAQRYSMVNGKRAAVNIPGTLLVVDCSSMKNINLTFIYEETLEVLKSKLPNYIEVIFGVLIILLIPFFIFQAESIDIQIYKDYFQLSWYEKIIAYLLFVQILSILNPFIKVEKSNEYKYVNLKSLIAKFSLIAIMLALLWILS